MAFGCPESKQYYPKLNFNCRAQIWTSLMAQKLQNPIGAVYVYSDLRYVSLHRWLPAVGCVGCVCECECILLCNV